MKISNKVKDIGIKNRRYYFFNDVINIENFDSNNIKIDEKSMKDIRFYNNGYVTPKESKYIKILWIKKWHGYFVEINGNKYLTLVPTTGSKEKWKNIKNCGVKSDI